MASSPAPSPEFTETQWFYRRWWWLMAGVSILAVLPLALVSKKAHAMPALLSTGLLLLAILAGLWCMRLTVRVDAFGIHYQYIPLLNRWRHWPWNEFRQVFPRTYSPMGDYGGWGIRGFPGNLAYNVWGPAGLQLVFQSGNKLLLGTQQPVELLATLQTLHATDAARPIILPRA